MNIRKQLITLLLIILHTATYAQTGSVMGTVKNKNTQLPLEGASISIEKTNSTGMTDKEGSYTISGIPVGAYNIIVTYSGYRSETQFNIIVVSGATQFVNFDLETQANKIEGVKVSGTRKQSAIASDVTTPLSVQRLTATEIKSNPGGNFDVSKVIQALPGVAGSTGSAGFRNDIIIRGGAPNENVFYLDGIEIPVLNHFQTQGSAGGPTGILNVSFIEDVKLSSSAFDAKYDNAMASVFQFKQRDGNPKKFGGNIRLSGTEVAGTFEGPLSKNTTYLVSARRSYLQLLFTLIDIPIRPNFWDFQYKTTTKINKKTTLTFLGVGAIDEFTTATPKKTEPSKEFILRSVPFINQWNYTTGVTLKRLVNNGYYNIALSRNMFDNSIDQFENKQQNNEAFRNLKLRSQEIENKLRFDYNKVTNGWKWSAGASAQYVKFNASNFNKITILLKDSSGKPLLDSFGNGITNRININYNTAIDFFRFGLFGQISKKFLDDKLGASLGVRSDMNTYTTTGMNPLNTFSPRIALSYAIAPKWQVSASVGTYYKLPIYTALGFKDATGNFVNKNVEYLRSTHYVAGVEFLPKNDLRFTVEGFYKQYSNYLVSKSSGISLANVGTDFLAIGNEAVSSNGKGNAYGFEIFVQQKLTRSIFATASYTYVRSNFSGSNGKLAPSAWDNIHLFSSILGKKFKRNWEMGLKLRATGGSPYTPYDTLASRGQFVLNGRGVLNYNQLNTLRVAPFYQFDFRLDKKYNFKKTTLDIFLDVANALVTKNESIPAFVLQRNATNTDFETTDNLLLNAQGTNGIPLVSINRSAIPTPTIGFIFEF
jgi:TonB dependent receptor/CarboxypepD_reg-like domain/TonB-dependent Receptor Plug Domain